MYQRYPCIFCEKDRARAVQDTTTGVADITFMGSRTLQFCPLSNNSQITMNNHVLVTYFTIHIKFIFVQRCLV